jgi:hypothetical protein
MSLSTPASAQATITVTPGDFKLGNRLEKISQKISKIVPRPASMVSRSASNAASNKEPNASNRVLGDGGSGRQEAGNGMPVLGSVADSGCDSHGERAGGGGVASKKQRWPRDKYNAYQRDYMKRRRAGS